jgi:uncharacterized alkaline shock family protein YloU
MMQNDTTSNTYGNVMISGNAIALIALQAARSVEGVTSIDSGFLGSVYQMLGRKADSLGIGVEIGDKEVRIDISLQVKYGIDIPEAASKVQEKIKEIVEFSTGLAVSEVNVNIKSITI